MEVANFCAAMDTLIDQDDVTVDIEINQTSLSIFTNMYASL